MELVRRECESGVFVRQTTLADRIGDDGQTPLDALHGTGGPGTRNFCTTTSCTLVMSGSFEYEITATRRVSGAIAADQPPPPPTITGVSERHTYLGVGWTPPPLPSGTSAIVGYRVEAWSTPTGGLVASTEINASSNAADLTGLTDGVSYWVVVYARNAAGFGEPSSPWGPATPQATTPTAVQSVSVVAAGVNEPGALDVTWVAPEEDGGKPISDYELKVTRQSDGAVQTFTVDGSTLAYQVPNLDEGANYEIVLRAKNQIGWGSPSDPVVTPTRPPRPTAVSAAAANGAALVTFTLANNGDESLLADNAVRIVATCTVPSAACVDATFLLDHPSPTAPNATVGPLDTSTALPAVSLSNGQTYNVTVEVQNESGWSRASAPAAVTPVTNPESPAALVSIEATGVSNELAFSVAPGANNGGSTITSYEVTEQGTGRKRTVPAAASGDTDFTWDDDDTTTPAGGIALTNFTNYTFKVEACNAVGCSSSSPGYVAAPGIPPAGTITVAAGSAEKTIVATGNPTGGTTSSGTTWTVVCGSKTQTITGAGGSTTFTGMSPGSTTCTGTPRNSVQRVVAGASGTKVIDGAAVTGTVEVYDKPSQPGTPTVTKPTSGIVNNVSVSVPSGVTSGGSNPAIEYVATCGGVSSTRGPGARTVSGLSPGSTVTCTVVAYNVLGYASAVSPPTQVHLQRNAPSVQSMEGTRTHLMVQDSRANSANIEPFP